MTPSFDISVASFTRRSVHGETSRTDHLRTWPALDTDESVPDIIVPEQFFDLASSAVMSLPERRLMLAILLDAIRRLRRKGSSQAVEVVRWIRNREDWPCSFERVCQALELEPSRLGVGLLTWYESGRSHLLGAPIRRPRAHRIQIVARRGRRRRSGSRRRGVR